MDRPHLVNFSAIIAQNQISIRASISKSKPDAKNLGSRTPLDSISLFKKDVFKLKLVAYGQDKNPVFERIYDTDNYGKLELNLPAKINGEALKNLTLFDVGQISGLDIFLGSILPVQIEEHSKILITDFDKTLVDTKYSTPKEMYYSLNRPLNHFPSVNSSIELVKKYASEGFQTFVLSASPHFYEPPIRDWLYQNQIYVSNLFLKDYRDFISIFDGPLSAKDIKKQGFYKLNQLIDILLMTKIPQKLVLMGDGFESDPYIYLTLKKLIQNESDPWKVWKSIKNHSIFSLTSKQDSFFITKFYQLSEMAKKTDCDVEIHIRATESNITLLREKDFGDQSLNKMNSLVRYYVNK